VRNTPIRCSWGADGLCYFVPVLTDGEEMYQGARNLSPFRRAGRYSNVLAAIVLRAGKVLKLSRAHVMPYMLSLAGSNCVEIDKGASFLVFRVSVNWD
jgi:hypothetical protein